MPTTWPNSKESQSLLRELLNDIAKSHPQNNIAKLEYKLREPGFMNDTYNFVMIFYDILQVFHSWAAPEPPNIPFWGPKKGPGEAPGEDTWMRQHSFQATRRVPNPTAPVARSCRRHWLSGQWSVDGSGWWTRQLPCYIYICVVYIKHVKHIILKKRNI